MGKKRAFPLGAPVCVARGPYKGETGIVLEFCDDIDFLVVDFGPIRVKILASVLVDNTVKLPRPVKVPKLQTTSSTLLHSSHRGRGKK